MGSKAERDPPAMFDWFFEAACPASLQEDPPILRQFPPDFRDQEAMQMVPKFCFPFDVEREPPSPAVQHFTFALTDLSGTRRFGFCHLRAGAHSCLCILSHLPWFEVFYKLLNTVGDLLAQNQVSEVEELLLNLLQQPLPRTQGSGVTVSSAQSIPPPAPGNSWPLSCFVAPDSGRLPSIPENRNLTELVVAVTHENIVGLFAALLAERRVLLTASKLSTTGTAAADGIPFLLHPQITAPARDPQALSGCPHPYSPTQRVREKALEEVVVMNVDSNTLETPFDDVQALPPDVVSLLRLRLRKVALTPGEGVSRLFLKAQALLFGGYRDALICSPGQPVTFSEEAFLAQKPGAPLQAFHRRAVHLQLFKQFIEGRLEKLNTGEGFSDLFEQEITCSGASSGALRSYQLWADNLKKGGGALLHSVKAKTQPAVKNMYRSAKSGLKGVQSLLMYKDGDSGLQRGGSLRALSLTSRSDRLQQRLPITQHFGKNRPLRPSRRRRLEETPSESLEEVAPALSPEDAQDPWAEEALDSSFLGSGEELDLLSEILDSLSVGASRTGSLRPSQSLDCCHRGDPDSCFSLVRAPQFSPTSPSDFPSSSASADPSTAKDPRVQESPCTQLSTAPTHSSPPESPQLLVSTKPNLDITWTSQPLDSSSDPGSSENPRSQPSEVPLAEHAHLQLPEGPGALRSPAAPANDWQEPQARSRPRVAELKKCFEG
uniref:DENN domain containing 1C n=1 Tax=Ursus maritimus TaxID=29073 RepID=A0A452U3F1_URSMA